ncbi:cysteine hydrolase [Candidatus Parcubacteria bacterium]|nr:MAG: cysteine hydrolase [Candidatus Parcubacteria bacterium]
MCGLKPALVIVDMIKDNVGTEKHYKVAREAREILPSLKRFIEFARAENIPIIYVNDSFIKGDFIFRSGLSEHALRGTEGTQVIEEIMPRSGDYVMEKLRFSAFYRTDLDQVLRRLGVDTVIVTGVSTIWCVLLTAADALANDFYTIILEDLTAAHNKEVKSRILDTYRNFVLYPLLKIIPSELFIAEYNKREKAY